ncbi:MAG: PilZ domain-containing protein [Telmatospirillum sp.]|nr:PilZ domain-containing protein [Telmatospirillum sp.]
MVGSRQKQIGRKAGDGLVVLIEGRCYPLVTISVNGLSFQATGHHKGELLTLKLAQLFDMRNCVEGRIRVVDAKETTTVGEFVVTMDLMRYIIRHMSAISGVSPVSPHFS